MPNHDLSERDIITQLILPALRRSGWDIEKQVAERREQAVLRQAFS